MFCCREELKVDGIDCGVIKGFFIGIGRGEEQKLVKHLIKK